MQGTGLQLTQNVPIMTTLHISTFVHTPYTVFWNEPLLTELSKSDEKDLVQGLVLHSAGVPQCSSKLLIEVSFSFLYKKIVIVSNWAGKSVWDGPVFVDGVRKGEMGEFQIIF